MILLNIKDKTIGFLDKIILFCIYATAFFLPIAQGIIESVSILAIVCFIVKSILQRKVITKTAINIGIFAYILVCFVSIFNSTSVAISTRTFFCKLLQNLLFFFVVADTLNTKQRVKNLIYIFCVSSFVLGVDGVYQFFTHKDFIRHRKDFGIPRIYATFPSPNAFVCYLYMVLSLLLMSFFSKEYKKIIRFLFIVVSALLFICIILTVSRGGWLAFLSMILFMSVWSAPLRIFFMGAVLIIIFTHQFYFPYLKERISNFFVFADNSSSDRNVIWDTALRMFKHKPWIGVGLGTFMLNFNQFVVGVYQYGVPYAHNCYLQIAAETGVIGLASFLSILVLFFAKAIELLSAKEKGFYWYILLASASAILGYCIQMTVDTIFYALDLSLLFWFMLGIGCSAIKQIELESVK